MSKQTRIYITPETISPDEQRRILLLLDRGWDMVHLRFPMATAGEIRQLIEAIPQCYHSRLRLHDHFNLTDDFRLGGLHLNHRNPLAPQGYTGSVSRSCHSIAEVRESTGCDYVTLSPVFDSISKAGYRAAFSREELMELNDIASPAVMALGGITPQRLPQIEGLGFSGYAVKVAIDLFLNDN